MQPVIEFLVFIAGCALVVWTLIAAIKTVVLPRGEPVFVTGVVFELVGTLFRPFTRRARTFEDRDRALALYAPVALVLLPAVWMALVLTGYTAIFWAIGIHPVQEAFRVSGSSLLTLGFAPVTEPVAIVIAFSEATIGLGLMALLIAYLPSMYSAFSRREMMVSLLEVRAGAPPSAVEMLKRAHRIRSLSTLRQEWERWELWFAELEETHTSLAALVFFRSPQAGRSWVTASGAVLDAAALMASSVDVPREPTAELCIRAGYLALRQIAAFFEIEYDPDPRSGDPISISRSEFEAAYDELSREGVPLRANREQCWRDFAGWRVNYDRVLLALAALTMAPYAPWSSDRSHRKAGQRHPWRSGWSGIRL